MRNLYLAPRSNETAYKNYVSSMQGVPKSSLEHLLTDNEKEQLDNVEMIHAWGCQPNLETYWRGMNSGDYVMFYAKGKFISVGELIFKKKSDELALALWPRNKDTNQPWSCVFFVDKLIDIDLPLEDFNAVTGYNLGLVRGFMPVRKGTEKIEDKFGSVEGFIDSLRTGLKISEIKKFESISTKPISINSHEDIAEFDELTRDRNSERLLKAIEEHAKNASGRSPEQVTKQVTTYKRNRKLVKDIKAKYDDRCQICGFTFKTSSGSYYSEAAHIIPISSGEEGVDSPDNIWVLCANHHKMLDHGAIQAKTKSTYTIDGVEKDLLER